jgi:hypothetical protein
VPAIIATLSIDATGVVLDLRADGQPLLSKPKQLEPGDTLTLADALATVTGESDVRDVMRGLIAPVADQLEQRVQTNEAALERDKAALAAFQQALTPPQP